MGRIQRDIEAGIFHVYSHSVWTSEFFRNDLDHLVFLREVARAGNKVGWTCVTFCLLPTHYHFILEVERGALPAGMHALNFRYAQGFNVRHHLRGHVVAGRYGSRRIEDDEDLLNTYSYVARNPIEAGVCVHPAEWAWSSYAGTVDLAAAHSFVDPRRVLDSFNCPRDLAIARLRGYFNP